MIPLTVALLLGGLLVTEAEALMVSAPSGTDVAIECAHSNAFSNVKYFCRWACSDADVLVSSGGKKRASNGRYSIRDEGNTFYVTISRVTPDDSGTYLCGVERVGVDTYNEVVLRVTEDVRSPQTHFLSSKKLVYIGAGLGVLLLVLAVILLVFIYQRRGHIATPAEIFFRRTVAGKGRDTTASGPKQEAQPVATVSSSPANRCGETGDRCGAPGQEGGRDGAGVIYSSVAVASEPRSPPGDLLYSAVTRSADTGHDAGDLPAGADVTYSAISFTSAAETSVYCNV